MSAPSHGYVLSLTLHTDTQGLDTGWGGVLKEGSESGGSADATQRYRTGAMRLNLCHPPQSISSTTPTQLMHEKPLMLPGRRRQHRGGHGHLWWL